MDLKKVIKENKWFKIAFASEASEAFIFLNVPKLKLWTPYKLQSINIDYTKKVKALSLQIQW